jgi:type III restriction enzyme
LGSLGREHDIQKYLHTSSTSDVHSILFEFFSERGKGFFVPPILKLRKIELTSFIISKYKRLRDDAKEMDSNNLNLFDSSSRKNTYGEYSEANGAGQSKPEILFEKWLEKSERIKWWYRSFDRGEKYFSIAFGAKKMDFS